MTAELGILSRFEDEIIDLGAARDLRKQYGSYTNTGNHRENTLNSLNYDDAKAAEAKAFGNFFDAVMAADNLDLSDPQKSILIKVAADRGGVTPKEVDARASRGFSMFERVQKDLELNRGVIASIGEKSISLFISNGADDIEVSEGVPRSVLPRAIRLAMPGRTVDYGRHVSSIGRKQRLISPFHLRAGQDKYSAVILGSDERTGLQPMPKFDPESEQYTLPFHRLGTAEYPLVSLDELITETDKDIVRPSRILGSQCTETIKPSVSLDHKRYAARLAIASLDGQDWLKVTPPSGEFKDLAVRSFARAYVDLLGGSTDKSAFTELTAQERSKVMQAADITKDEVALATRSIIEGLNAEDDTASGIMKTIRYRRALDEFLGSL